MAEALLSLRGVKTDIGRYHILHGVEFDVAEGGLTMLLGRNGAGKTTLLRAVSGTVRRSGAVRIGGEDVSRAGAARAADPDASTLLKRYDEVMGPANFEMQATMVAHRDDGTSRAYKMKVQKSGDKFRLTFTEPSSATRTDPLAIWAPTSR